MQKMRLFGKGKIDKKPFQISLIFYGLIFIFYLDFFIEKHRICVQCTGRKIAAVEGIQIHQERLEARMAGEVHFL